MHELHTAMYAPLLEVGCDQCGWGRGSARCRRSFALGDRGQITRVGDPSLVVSWPRCPHNYAALRQFGQDILPLDACVAWAYERQVHLDPNLGAGGQRLIGEWLRNKEAPGVMKLRREEEERRRNGGRR